LARPTTNHSCFFEAYQLRRLFGLDYNQCRSFRGNISKVTFDFGLVGKFIVYFMTQHTRFCTLHASSAPANPRGAFYERTSSDHHNYCHCTPHIWLPEIYRCCDIGLELLGKARLT
jgi:hypothetical protein